MFYIVRYIKSALKYFEKGFKDRNSRIYDESILDVPISLFCFVQVLITLVGLNELLCAAAFQSLISHLSFPL